MVNLMFGANAPKLSKIITDELRNEIEANDNTIMRQYNKITDLSAEEQLRFEISERSRIENEKIEKVAEETTFRDRLMSITDHLLDPLQQFGIIMIFPHAKDKIKKLLSTIDSSGLRQIQSEKFLLTESYLPQLTHFSQYEFPKLISDVSKSDLCMVYLVKSTWMDVNEVKVDNIILRAVYGDLLIPPGDLDSIAQYMSCVIKEEGQEINFAGIWVPDNSRCRVMAIKTFFPKLCDVHLPSEPTLIPPHLAMAFDIFKRKEVQQLVQEFQMDVMRFGFFSSDDVKTARLIVKDFEGFEKKFDGTTL